MCSLPLRQITYLTFKTLQWDSCFMKDGITRCCFNVFQFVLASLDNMEDNKRIFWQSVVSYDPTEKTNQHRDLYLIFEVAVTVVHLHDRWKHNSDDCRVSLLHPFYCLLNTPWTLWLHQRKQQRTHPPHFWWRGCPDMTHSTNWLFSARQDEYT